VELLMTPAGLNILLPAVALVVIAFIMGFLARIYLEQKIHAKAEEEAERIVEEARREAENLKQEAIWEGQEEVEERKQEIEEELGEEKRKLEKRQSRLEKRESELEEKLEQVYEETNELKAKRNELEERKEAVQQQLKEADKELERISGLTAEEAEKRLRNSLLDEAKREAAQQIKKIKSEAESKAEQQARRVIARALQRCAVEETTEATVKVVELPSDDMKGRIIGRDGRNIRAFEKVTGVDLIVDDTPEAVTISCFDPIRRELASQTLEKLILDGRIQPARVEKLYEKTKKELDEKIWEKGEQALGEVGVPGVADELVQRIGELDYIVEGGQNQLDHSIQVAHLAGLLAAEIGADRQMARRVGILHAIGKTDRENSNKSYAIAGADLAKKHGESKPVVYAIAAHNEERPFKTVEGIILYVANKLSIERPGARKEKFGNFINRLQKLEDTAKEFDGVEESFAIQAGREMRVIVDAQVVDDTEAEILARDIAERIAEKVDYPDQIKISLLRENRVVDYAQ